MEYRFIDLHRHDEHSLFDGSGKPSELVKIAKELNYKSLGISNHGDMGGLVAHYFACKKAGIKPILGNEVYFQPNFKQTRTSFHLCLFIKNLTGYQNLNKIVTISNKDQYYYKPIVDFELLKKYHSGLICTSACIGGLLSQMVVKKRYDLAEKYAREFRSIFGKDFYIEIQPYKLTEKGLQEKTDRTLMLLAEKLNIPCILTSDSHFGSKKNFDSYLKMHAIAKHEEFGAQYNERYMPSGAEISDRFVKMHGNFRRMFETRGEARKYALRCIKNLNDLSDKVEDEILEKLPLKLPVFDENVDSNTLLKEKIIEGLKKRNKATTEYLKRCKEEFKVIKHHGFSDYFLIVQDYIHWAKKQGIEVGPGRGSVCNSLVAYALGITEVDSLYFNLDFRRFLRMDKTSFPEISGIRCELC